MERRWFNAAAALAELMNEFPNAKEDKSLNEFLRLLETYSHEMYKRGFAAGQKSVAEAYACK